ncbi:MAG: hypothetical protein CMP11_06025 [Zetaproteobacteria bacterium]|nr:hypothetical protein [Pseudobdellovibrionaceae bacterium]|tara:strand:+ start:527 stop:1036 length:510 start_codon:yes stop_codon:yes gene_type:complete
MMTKNDWKVLGVIGKPKGLKGEFHLLTVDGQPLSDEHDEVLFGEHFHKSSPATIISKKITTSSSLIALSTHSDRTAIDLERGKTVWGHKFVGVDPLDNLSGKEVFFNGQIFGVVVGSFNYGAGDVLQIKGSNNHFVDLPFNEEFLLVREETDCLELLLDPDAFADLWYR